RILSLSEDAIVMAVSPELLSVLDRYISFDTRILLVDFRPLSGSGSLYDEPEKPEPVFKKPKFNTVVDQIASSSALSEKRILKDLRILTGEDPQPKDIGEWHSRHSSTYGARRAAQWIKQQLEASLSSINGSTCSFFEYSPYFAPNVVCHIPAADTEGLVLVSAHLDSRGTFGSTTAPGGDDDGSGTGALLAIARAIGNAAVQFASPVQLVAFSGEEQGLVGSQKYAKSLRDLGTPVKLALQMDMLAYRKPGEPLQLAFPDKLSTKSATAHVSALAELYAPQLTTGFTPACCSDHQSFWEQGFPATWVFERNGPIADPMYHNSGDLTNRTGYDTEQLAAIAKVVTATLLNVAGF
ncbi:Zn-dependent exopeptidase, partial [Testicularia cyperi]